MQRVVEAVIAATLKKTTFLSLSQIKEQVSTDWSSGFSRGQLQQSLNLTYDQAAADRDLFIFPLAFEQL